MTNVFVAALDLGQRQDYSALTVFEQPLRYRGDWHFVSDLPDVDALARLFNDSWGDTARLGRADEAFPVRLLHTRRWPLNTSYPMIVEECAAELRPLRHYNQIGVDLLVDATGVGAPIVDLFRLNEQIPSPISVTITGGNETHSSRADCFNVPKKVLVMSGISLLETGRVRWPAQLPHRGILESELRNFQMTFSANGHELFEAGRGAHDDLVLAYCMGCWWLLRERPRAGVW